MIKRLLCCGSLCTLLLSADAQTLRTPQPSPTQTLRQDFGIGTIELTYSRPGVKGRTLGKEIAPFGKVWRTGANNATTLTFSDTVSIGGTRIAPGKYGLLSIPDKDAWTLIVSKQLNVTSPEAYKQEEDLVRVTAKPETLKQPVETFTIQFANIRPAATDLQLQWGTTSVSLPITTDVDARIMAGINSLVSRDNRPYFQAALYYLENGKDLNQALIWFDKAIEQNPTGFFIYHQKANALARLGRKEEARATAQRSIELARQAKNDDYVELNKRLIENLNK